jgi:tRNA A37 threonylcarbamoyladenosine synthetase subunit TsaC/SUA5/YrdC
VKEGRKIVYKFPSEEYKKAAATWEGPVALIFKAEPVIGLDEDFCI